jgi:hypothetical protein
LIAKYDPAGNPLWARSLGGTNRAGCAGLAVLNPGAVFMAGTFYGSAQFGNFNLTAENVQGLYVVRLAGMEPPAAPQILAQPQDQIVQAGGTATFNVTAPSGIPLSYQWYFNGTNPLPAGTSSVVALSNVQVSASGSYYVRVANDYGSATSSLANLTVYLTASATLAASGSFGSNQFQFNVDGVSGFSYAIEASTDLVDWVRLQTNAAPFQFIDSAAGDFDRRFYRAVLVK